jgi:hypothetical protein
MPQQFLARSRSQAQGIRLWNSPVLILPHQSLG